MWWKFLLAILIGASLPACVSHEVQIVPFLSPTSEAPLEELVSRINEWSAVRSLVLRVELSFETIEEAEKGLGRQYHSAKGRLLLMRPGFIRLNIEAPVLSANLAEMASDGERFQLLIYPPEYRALIEGRNGTTYAAEAAELRQDPQLRKAGPLVNIRPQHFTDAFLPAPIAVEDPDILVFHHEAIVVEPDLRPGAKKDAQVRKSYYVVSSIRRGEKVPRNSFWFDRLGAIRLARQQVFDGTGRLTADIFYSGSLSADAATGARLASRVRIERPHDDYTLVLDVDPASVSVNRDLPATAFSLTTPAEWGGNVRRIDLDERAKKHPR